MRWLLDTELTEVHSAVKYTSLPQFGGTLGYDACATSQLANGVAACFQFSGTVAESASSCSLEVVGSSTAVVKTTAHEAVTLHGDDPFKTEWLVKQPGPRMWGHLQQDEHFIAVSAGRPAAFDHARGRADRHAGGGPDRPGQAVNQPIR